MMTIISAGFREIPNFRGRLSRRRFWPYAAIVVGVWLAVWLTIIAALVGTIFMTELEPSGFVALPIVSAALVAVLIGLLGGAVTRRLHDRGLTGLVALPPPVLLSVSMFLLGRLLQAWSQSSGSLDSSPLLALVACNAIYLASLGALVVLLTLPGTPKPNRFGAPSDAAEPTLHRPT